MRCDVAKPLVALLIIVVTASAQEINAFDPENGVFIGDLSNVADGGVSGQVYVVNASTLQILNFTFNGVPPDVYFWLDSKETPTRDGLKIPTFEFGITPLGYYGSPERVVLNIPAPHKLDAREHNYKSLSVFSYKHEHNFGSVNIPEGLVIPRSQNFNSEFKAARYNLRSGPIYIMDRRTIKIYGFTFEGDRAPDTYFAVGRGTTVNYDTGIRVPIRGKDENGRLQIAENYRGGFDVFLDLPEEYDINHIDWLAVYCYKYRVNFGHVNVPSNISNHIPPYVPPQKRSEDLPTPADAWPRLALMGTENRMKFTFQLGPPGGERGYKAHSHMRTPQYVWYVNGLMAPDLYLKRNATYTFIVEGGNESEGGDLYNPLYVSSMKEGGYNKLSNEEATKVHIYSDQTPTTHTGRLCVWNNDDAKPDVYDSFNEYRKYLLLSCDTKGSHHIMKFTTNETTPAVLYYQSPTNFNMGGRIFVVSEMPQNITDIAESTFVFEDWVKEHSAEQQTSLAAKLSLASLLTVFVSFLF